MLFPAKGLNISNSAKRSGRKCTTDRYNPAQVCAPVPDDVDFRGCRVADVGQGALIAEALGRLAGAGAGYIDYPTSDTDAATRAAVAQWVGDALEAPIGADDIVLGLGAQNSIIMALQTVLNGPRPVILTEELTYPGVRHAARLLRAELVGVEMDALGLRRVAQPDDDPHPAGAQGRVGADRAHMAVASDRG